MGASGWQYVEDVPPVQPVDLGAALARLRERILAVGDFYYTEDEWRSPRPTTMEELQAIRDTEEFWEVGSHSILDVDHVIGEHDEDHDGSVRPLSPRETERLFRTASPDLKLFAERSSELSASLGRGWSGRCQVLYEDGLPTAVGFWGFSGD